jgi:hypothetical protein
VLLVLLLSNAQGLHNIADTERRDQHSLLRCCQHKKGCGCGAAALASGTGYVHAMVW